MAEKKETDVLLVDDDENLSAVTADFLEDDGLSVDCRQSGEEAPRALNGTRYRLLILGINLPDMTGFELCQKLRQATDVPILIVSARTSDTDRVTGLDFGGDDYISKPYSLRELPARVRANLRRRRCGLSSPSVFRRPDQLRRAAGKRSPDGPRGAGDRGGAAVHHYRLPGIRRYRYFQGDRLPHH